MNSNEDHTLSELGLPRANSNGVFIFALIVIAVFAVMAYSCTKERERNTSDLSSPPQPLSGSEWFAGKARGMELPKPPPPPPPAPLPKRPIQTARANPKPPQKKLGGKVFGESSTESPASTPEPPPEQLAMDNLVSFNSPGYPHQTAGLRPEYYLERNVELPISDFEVKAGTSIPAQLDIGINSDLGGPAVAHITRTIYDTVTGQFALIPPGTKLYGNIDPNITFGQTRVDVIWERIIFPNGASLVIQNMRGADRSGQVGLHHTVDNHFDRLFGGAVLLSGISAGVQLSQPQRSADFGNAPSVGQTLAGALGQNLGQVSTEFIRRQMNVRPTIIIPNGEHFTVTVNKDMVLPGPYGSWG